MQFQDVPSFVNEYLSNADIYAFDITFGDSSMVSASLFGERFTLRYANISFQVLSEALGEISQEMYQVGYACGPNITPSFQDCTTLNVFVAGDDPLVEPDMLPAESLGKATLQFLMPSACRHTVLPAFIHGVNSCIPPFDQAEINVFFRTQQALWYTLHSVVH